MYDNSTSSLYEFYIFEKYLIAFVKKKSIFAAWGMLDLHVFEQNQGQIVPEP